jgi:hypothetical protein
VSRRFAYSIVSAGIFVLAAGSLASGAAWLAAPLSQAAPIPAGNLVAAVLYISLAALTAFAARSGSSLAGAVAWLLLASAILWLPLSIWLAGNVNLNFTTSDWRAELWMYYTVMGLPGGCLLLLLWQLIDRAIQRSKRSDVEPDRAAERSYE